MMRLLLCLIFMSLVSLLQADIIIQKGSTKGNSNGTSGVNFDVNNDGVNELVFDPSGNVGLGVTSPSANLHVAGNLNLTGNIIGGLNKGLVGWWSFDEGTGTTLSDYAGYDYTGTLTNGPVWMDGKFNKALYFDGTNDYVLISDNDDLSFSDGTNDKPFSLSIWFYDQTGSGKIFCKADDVSDGEYYIINSSSTLYFRIVDDSATAHLGLATSNSFSTNTWLHVVTTYDGSKTNAGMNIYINGLLQSVTNSNSGTYSGMENTAKDLTFGKRATGYLNGFLDDARLYNRALSASEINELYRSKSSYFSKGGTISGNTTFSGNLSVASLNLPSMTVPSSPQTGDLYSTGSNLMFRNSAGVWVSAIDSTDSVWNLSSGNLSYDDGNLGIGSLSGAEVTVDNLTSTDNIIDLYDNNTLVFTVQNGGNVGVGTSSPSYNLDVSGNAAISSDLTISADLTMSGNIMPSANNTYHVGSTTYAWREIFSKDFVTISDRRLKTNIVDFGPAEDILNGLQPVHYTWKNNSAKKETGLIAQEVLKVYPQAVHLPKQKGDMLGVKYQALVPLIIQSQQEQHAQWRERASRLRQRLQKLKRGEP